MEYYDDIKELMKNDDYCIIGTECDYELNEVLCNYIRYNNVSIKANKKRKQWIYN